MQLVTNVAELYCPLRQLVANTTYSKSKIRNRQIASDTSLILRGHFLVTGYRFLRATMDFVGIGENGQPTY